MHRDGRTYLLGLCEGNRCKGGAEGRVPGGGRIHVFRRGRRNWDRVGKIRLPETVLFEDYSGIAVTGDRIAVDIPGLLGTVARPPRAGRLAGHGRRHQLRAAEGR